MLATRNDQGRPAARTALCAVCGRSSRVSPLKSPDGDVICKTCRCQRCSIPISAKPCNRCGVAHGTPSTRPGLCERCFEIVTIPTVHVPVHEDAEHHHDTWSSLDEGTFDRGYVG